MAQKKRTTSRKRTTKSGARTRKTKAQLQREYALRRDVYLLSVLCICILLFLCNFHLIGKIGEIFSSVMSFLFGVLRYVFPVFLLIAIWFKALNPKNPIATRKLVFGTITFIDLGIIADVISGISSIPSEKYIPADYIKYFMNTGKGGGFISGSISYLLGLIIGKIGTVIAFILILIICLIFLTEKSVLTAVKEQSENLMENSAERKKIKDEYNLNLARAREEEAKKREERENLREQELLEKDERKRLKAIERENEKHIREEKKALEKEARENDKILRKQNIHRGVTFNTSLDGNAASTTSVSSVNDDIHQINVNNFDSGLYEGENPVEEDEIFLVEDEPKKVIEKIDQPPVFGISSMDSMAEINSIEIQKEDIKPVRPKSKPSVDFGDDSNGANNPFEPEIKRPKKNESPKAAMEFSPIAQKADANLAVTEQKYIFPSIELLNKNTSNGARDSEQSIRETAQKLTETLSIFGVNAKVTEISQGPSVTRFELQPELGVKVSRIKGLSDDIKLSLAASDIRIEAPIPGKSAVGIEVPNKVNQAVLLRELIDTPAFRASKSNLAFAIGKDIAGQVVVYDIDKFPHLLIAGATGSGKSVCINTLIMSIIYKADPDDVKLIMIDPKVVELSVYNDIPHLLIPVVTEAKKASQALNWAVAEMMERYKIFAELNVRDLEGYNEKIESLNDPLKKKKPQIVIIVDELADLMMVAKNEVEDAICRLAQLARACGIHLIIATQRPSVDVITGLIKANMPSRIAFAVSSMVDSRTILDMGGAEELLGKGDMLFFPKGLKKPVRLQGGFVSDGEVNRVVDFLKANHVVDEAQKAEMEMAISSSSPGSASSASSSSSSDSNDSGYDEFLVDAGRLIISSEKASIGMLQRKFRIGFNRAARIMDTLAELGVVSEEEGTKPRRILMDSSDFESLIEDQGL